MAILSINNNITGYPWFLEISNFGNYGINTKGTYLDRDIQVSVPLAVYSLDSLNSSKVANSSPERPAIISTTTNPGNGIYITPEVNISKEGWLSNASDEDSKHYITGVELSAPASGEQKFSITVPQGSGSTKTFTFHVNSSGVAWVD